MLLRKPPIEQSFREGEDYEILLVQHPTLQTVLNDPLARWLYLLVQGYKDEHEMEVLTNMTDGMKAFAKRYNRSLDDPKLRDLYELDLSARRDQAAVAYTAEMKGILK